MVSIFAVPILKIEDEIVRIVEEMEVLIDFCLITL